MNLRTTLCVLGVGLGVFAAAFAEEASTATTAADEPVTEPASAENASNDGQDNDGDAENTERFLVQEPSDQRAVLHFADAGGIRDWKALGDRQLLIEGTNRRWFLATFRHRCLGLRTTDAVGFVTGVAGDLSRFDSILVRDRRCYFQTFERIDEETARSLKEGRRDPSNP